MPGHYYYDKELGSHRWFDPEHHEIASITRERKIRWFPDLYVGVDEFGEDSGDDHLYLIFRWFKWSIYAHLFIIGPTTQNCWERKSERYGWYLLDDSLNLYWGESYYSWDIPFTSMIYQSNELLHLDSQNVVACLDGDWDERQAAVAKQTKTFPYRYSLKSGEVQQVTASVYLSRRTWRRKWTWIKHVSNSIDIRFSSGVGERSGSWKGGCTGCSFSILPGETVEQCLRRMEATRFFD